MANLSKVRGFSTVLGNMRRQQQKHARGFQRGLLKAGYFLLAKSKQEVPVDEGNLKASGFVRAAGSGFAAKVEVGYTAGYALYVHENLDAAHGEEFNIKYAAEIAAGTENSRGPGQKAKFLEDPAKNSSNKRQMRDIMAAEMKR